MTSYIIHEITDFNRARHPFIGTHRGEKFNRHVMTEEEYHYCGVAVGVLELGTTWWIVPITQRGEELMTDIGPFDHPDDAFVYLKLAAEHD